ELLQHTFNTSSGKWTDEQKGAVAGKYWGYCVSHASRYPNARPENCDAAVKDEVANNPELKAKGVRCTFQDNLVNVFGKDPETGSARTRSTMGAVKYGLKSSTAGKTNFTRSVRTTSRAGGPTITAKTCPRGMTGDPGALGRPYKRGGVNAGTASPR